MSELPLWGRVIFAATSKRCLLIPPIKSLHIHYKRGVRDQPNRKLNPNGAHIRGRVRISDVISYFWFVVFQENLEFSNLKFSRKNFNFLRKQRLFKEISDSLIAIYFSFSIFHPQIAFETANKVEHNLVPRVNRPLRETPLSIFDPGIGLVYSQFDWLFKQ